MTDILVPVSPGELLDKITILRIKVARMQDAVKLANVKLELSLLEQTWRESGCAAQDVSADEHALQHVNERLWDIEDRIRDKEAKQSFDRDFIELARASTSPTMSARRSRSASTRSSAPGSSRKSPTSSTASPRRRAAAGERDRR